MEFESFFKQANNQSFWHSKNVFCFQAPNYSFTFFNLLFKLLIDKQILHLPLKKVKLDPSEHHKLISLVSQSILGNHFSYWLGDLPLQFKDKQKQQIIPFLSSYTGPNQLFFFIDHETATAYKKNIDPLQPIMLKNSLSYSDFQLLLTFFNQQLHPQKQNVIKKIFAQLDTLTLDFACMLIQYLELINHKFADEFLSYVSSLLPHESSLTALSESFFARNAQSFFKTWSMLKDEYPDMFWIAYWSEQLWKAYHVIKFIDQQNFIKAKKVSYRLPYSFIQKYSKSFSLKQIALLHQQLYMIDFMIKNGSTFCSLDFFYFTHFFKNTSHNRLTL